MGKWAETEEAYFGRLDTQEGKSMEMREILFRGKRVIDGKWVESCCPLGEMHSGTVTYDFDSKTVCQYIGLTDKNGRKIFEWDIVKTSQYGVDDGNGHNYNGCDKFSVEFSDGSFCLKNKWRRFNLQPQRDFEVIGNIFDNPDLME